MKITFKLLITLLISGLHLAAQDGMILDNFSFSLEENLPEWIFKPLIGCPQCMAE